MRYIYFIKTPVYSLNIVKDAIKNHDVVNFKKHVDLDSLLSRGFDDSVAAAMESNTTMNQQAKTFADNFIKMLKPSIVSVFKDSLIRFVETGSWENKEQDNSSDKKITNVDPNKMADKTGIKKAEFKGIESTKKDRKVATVGIKIFDPEVNKDFILDVRMRELDDGTWQVSEISNLKNYMIEVEKAKISAQ